MRFGFFAGGVVLASFLAGYGSSFDAPRNLVLKATPADVSVKPAPHEAPVIESSTTPRSGSAPDLLAAMRPFVDSIRQGERILSAIDALDASAMAALFTPPRSVEFQQRLEKLSSLREAILDRAMTRWLDLDPAGALAWLPTAAASFPSDLEDSLDVCVWRVLHPLTKRFSQEAVAFALGMPVESWNRQYAARGVIGEIARTNPALDWAWENAVPLDRKNVPNRGSSGSFSALETAFEAAPDETLDWLAHLPPGAARDRLLAHAFADGTMPDFRQDELREKMGLAVKP